MKVVVAPSLTAVFVLIAGGCGSDGAAGGSQTLSPTSSAPFCEAACDQEVACDPQTNRPDCIGSCMETGATIRGSIFVDIYSCRADLPCGTNDDICEPSNVDPLPIHDAYQDDCVATLTECAEQADVIGELCGTDNNSNMAEMLPVLGTDITQSLLDCLQSPCADIPDCIDDVVDF